MRAKQEPIAQKSNKGKVIALAGNPNVGKSTIFNALTGMHQHTGNWPGKTVGNAMGNFRIDDEIYTMVDIPGTYSLFAHSREEEIARDFLCFGEADAIVIVCDATCLLRNLNLVLQTLEISKNIVLCMNLMDEAAHRHISVNCHALSQLLGVSVVPTVAGRKKGLKELKEKIASVIRTDKEPFLPCYRPEIEKAISLLEPAVSAATQKANTRWLSLKLLEGEASLLASIGKHLNCSPAENPAIAEALANARTYLAEKGYDKQGFRDALVSDIFQNAESIFEQVVTTPQKPHTHQIKIDRFVTGKVTGIPVMLLLLLGVLWLTVVGANYPSQLLSSALFSLEMPLFHLLENLHLPLFMVQPLVFGVYRVLSWVVSVMLPPMAIFFPLFTLLEDLGYLPRVAFNLDNAFKKCHSCGKQALTMCMGLGCNAVGVVGCRIIDSPRERLLAILTNCFVPCNGRFPTLVAIITMFFTASSAGIGKTAGAALLLSALIVLSVFITLAVTRVLSQTVLKGIPSSYVLELPPYRRPQVGKVLLRSVLDRTLFVLGRAVSVAAPAGLVIYLFANITFGGASLLTHCASFLDPFARLLGLDGVLLLSFILGFPANEIVMPIAIMAYLSQGTLSDFGDLNMLKSLLIENGWTQLTALCTMIFSLFHWPCSTTFLSIKKETGSLSTALGAFLLPTGIGMLLCFLLATFSRLCFS